MDKMILATAVFAAGNVFGAIRAVTPDLYGGNANASQMTRHAEKMAVVANGGAQVVFIGDSITHGFENCAVWSRFLSGRPYKALNLGTAGDCTDQVLGRLVLGGELDGYEAKIVLLMIGTNNAGRSSFSKEPPSDTILGIREILRVIRRKQPKAKIVLMPIFPREKETKHGDCARRNAVVNREIRKLADGEDILWCDFNEQFLTPEGRLPRELFPDQLHPAEHGYEIWYSAVKPYIEAALSDGRLPMPSNRYAPFVRKESVRVDELQSTYPDTRITGLDDGWLDRLLRNRNRIPESKGAVDLVFIGDSAIQGWETRAPELETELRKTYTLLNLGYAGDRTEHIVWRCANGELDGYKAKCIMLMAGTYNTWKRKAEKAESVAAGVKRILEVVAEKQPKAKVLLLPIFPVSDSSGYPTRATNAKANELIRELADGERVVWVDFTAKLSMDGLFPTAAAYREVWLPAVLPYFRKYCGK